MSSNEIPNEIPNETPNQPPKNSQGFYKKEDLIKLKNDEIIKLLIQESSFQSTINMVRDTVKEYYK